MTSAVRCGALLLVALAIASSVYSQTTLNLSEDLVARGIAGTNMIPNQPSLDAGPLFFAGVEYAKAHGVTTIVADKGTYYFASLANPNWHVQLQGINNATIDLHGSDLVFSHPLAEALYIDFDTNVVFQNFTVDYQPLPFTQVSVVSVNPATAQIRYAVQPGWQDPNVFDSAPSGTIIQVHIFRNGQPAVGTRRMAAQPAIAGNLLTIIPYADTDPTPENMAMIRPGDIAVVAMRTNLSTIVADRCVGCTFRNISVYSGTTAAITTYFSTSSTLERFYMIPKPETDRLVSALGINSETPGPNSTIRLNRAIRSMDDGYGLFSWVTGMVQDQPSARSLTVAGVTNTTLDWIVSVPDGSGVAFEDKVEGSTLGSAVVVSQIAGSPSVQPYLVTYTFDRDLPAGLVGSYMYATDSTLRSPNSVIERNLAQANAACCTGFDIGGWASNSTVHGNYVRGSAFAAIMANQHLEDNCCDDKSLPLVNLSFSNNVIDGANVSPARNLPFYSLGAVQVSTLRSAPGPIVDLMPTSPHQNITFVDNFIADAGRSALWVGNTAGGSISGNYLLRAGTRPDTADAYPAYAADATIPMVIDATSHDIVTGTNPNDQTSGRFYVTDPGSRELAAYAPGSTVRLSAYNLGALATPAITLTDADGVTRSVAIQGTSSHALDVQIPTAAALGGAFLTLTSGGTKYFGTLFVDSQDNIPAVNGCIYEAQSSSSLVPAVANSLPFLVVTQAGCAYQATASDAWVTPSTGNGPGVLSIAIAANTGGSRATTIEIAGQPFTITQSGAPSVTLDRSALIFTGVSNGAMFTAVTPPQTVRLTQSGPGTVSWTASSNAPWLVVSPTSGSGTATLTISTPFTPGLSATQTGAITVTITGAGNAVGPITVTLHSLASGTSAAPFGSFDTPTNGTTGVAGSIAVTGWALDDVGVTRVTICRDLGTGESVGMDPNCANNAQIYIGDAVFIDGARSDVQMANPTLPMNSRGGWGYLLLTNFLPGLGNGTFTLRAYAFDADSHPTALGAKTITCANAASVAPFGAIDVPGQGAIVSGTIANVGWVLSPGTARSDPPGGGTVHVFVDGVDQGAPNPGLWNARPDLTALFDPKQFSGVGTALGVHGLDTTTLANGVHTIFWLATGTGGTGTSGIGSRFFNVSNGSLQQDPTSPTSATLRPSAVIAGRASLTIPAAGFVRVDSSETLATEIAAAPREGHAIRGRRGFDLTRGLQSFAPSSGRVEVQAEELDRIELHVSRAANQDYTGYQRTTDGFRPLPAGSTLDPSTGVFTWAPGVGFYGAYDLTFVRWSGGRAAARQDVRIMINAKGTNRVGPQTIVDAPAPDAGSHDLAFIPTGTFAVGGWAADLDSTVDSGVTTVHVWAYPVSARGDRLDPIFLGLADYGGARPDVAAIYGDRFGATGYGLIVDSLPPGTYDIAVFAYSTVVGNFTPAKIVRVRVGK